MRDRTGPLALAVVALLSGVLDAADPKPAAIGQTDRPIVIDGVLDDAAWQRAVPVDVCYVHGKAGQRSREPRMTAKYAWDEHYLYLAYETFDKNLIALGTGDKKGPKGNERERCVNGHPTEKVDVVEFFISFGDERVFWEVHHNAANHFSDILCIVADDSWPISQSTLFRFGIHFGTDMILQDDRDAGRTRAMAVKLKPKKDGQPSTINDSRDEDTGYIGELRLPWHGLGAPVARETFVIKEENGQKKNFHGPWKMAGQELRILAVVQDGDLADRYHHSSPQQIGGWFHKTAALWPRYVLEPAK
jgi:hypothetical protein